MSDELVDALIASVHNDLAASIIRDELCLILWGKSWNACTEHERNEATRLQRAPLGGGFVPSAASVLGSGETE